MFNEKSRYIIGKERDKMKVMDGGVTTAKGFQAACCEANIKYKNRTDMAMVYSSQP